MARCGTAASIRKIITSKVGQKCTLYVTRENDRGNDSVVEGKFLLSIKKNVQPKWEAVKNTKINTM